MLETMKKLKGSFAIAFTPFKENGDVDYDDFAREVKYLSQSGAKGVVLYGMTSEYHKLTDAEKEKLTMTFLDVLKDSPVVSVLSVTDWSTEVAVKTAQKYESLGVDMLMLMPPFYYGPSLDEIRHHMVSVLQSVDIPVIIQYAPLATKLYMPEEELVEMSNTYPNAAFKIEYRPAKEFMSKFFQLKRDMPIMTGWAGLEIVDLYTIGVKGVITVGGFPEIYAAIFKALSAGDITGAHRIYDQLEIYISHWMINPESLLAIEKEILKRRGKMKSSYCRHPAYRLTAENNSEIDRFLDDFKEYLA